MRITHQPLPAADDSDDPEADPEAVWSLDFWRVDRVEPPQWLARSTPPVRPRQPGWRAILAADAVDLVESVSAARRDDDGYTTVEALQHWGIVHGRGPGWLDEPVRYDPFDYTPAAAQLRTPTPTVLRDLLPFFTAAGWLSSDGTGYRNVPNPPRVQAVLNLPADQVANLELRQGADQYSGLATDLASIALWAAGSNQTVSSLASRTLASDGDVRAAITWAQRRGILEVNGAPDNQLALTPHPDPL